MEKNRDANDGVIDNIIHDNNYEKSIHLAGYVDFRTTN